MIKFEFTLDEANTVLGALSAQPYQQVSALIEKIRQQAAPQVQQVQAVESDAATA